MLIDSPITVTTLTRRRPGLLARAIASVRSQDYAGPIEHLVVVDDDPESVVQLEEMALRANDGPNAQLRRLRWHLAPRSEQERRNLLRERGYVYPRLARLLNIGVRLASSPWVAFLDDDNEYEPNHLSSLAECAHMSGSRAVHAARRVFNADGTPYLEKLFPGAANTEAGARLYRLMCDRGVWVPGTNILQDRVDPDQTTFRNSTVMDSDDPMFLVDQNLWLIDRKILLTLPVPEDFTPDEIDHNTCPDDKMLEVLVRNRIDITSSRLPTVRYYLGGISNGDEQPRGRLSGIDDTT